MRFSSTVSPGKMPRASGTSSSPHGHAGTTRAPVMSLPDEQHRAARRCHEPGGDRAQRRLARRRSRRAARRPCRTATCRSRRAAPRRRRSPRRCRRARAPTGASSARQRSPPSASGRVQASRAPAPRRRAPRLGRGDPQLVRSRSFARFFVELLLPDEREDAVGLLARTGSRRARTGSA